MSIRRTLVSEAEFLSLPESVEKIELVDGEVIVSPPPSPWHQRLLGRVFIALSAWAERQPAPVCVFMAPLDVRLASGRILQPDAFLLFGRVGRDEKGPLTTCPALCVEIVSENRAFDLSRVEPFFNYYLPVVLSSEFNRQDEGGSVSSL